MGINVFTTNQKVHFSISNEARSQARAQLRHRVPNGDTLYPSLRGSKAVGTEGKTIDDWLNDYLTERVMLTTTRMHRCGA